jgi:hypothetical protein
VASIIDDAETVVADPPGEPNMAKSTSFVTPPAPPAQPVTWAKAEATSLHPVPKTPPEVFQAAAAAAAAAPPPKAPAEPMPEPAVPEPAVAPSAKAAAASPPSRAKASAKAKAAR